MGSYNTETNVTLMSRTGNGFIISRCRWMRNHRGKLHDGDEIEPVAEWPTVQTVRTVCPTLQNRLQTYHLPLSDWLTELSYTNAKYHIFFVQYTDVSLHVPSCTGVKQCFGVNNLVLFLAVILKLFCVLCHLWKYCILNISTSHTTSISVLSSGGRSKKWK